MTPFRWSEPAKKEAPKVGMFDPELKISEDAKQFITAVLDRIEAILKSTIFYKEQK
jgi:hypothetical protein